MAKLLARTVGAWAFLIVVDECDLYISSQYLFDSNTVPVEDSAGRRVPRPVSKEELSCGFLSSKETTPSRTEPSFLRVRSKSFVPVWDTSGDMSKSYEHGEWHPDIIEQMRQRLSRPDIGEQKLFIDVGANVGFFAVYAAMLGAEVVAIEPLPTHVCYLLETAELNNLSGRIRAHKVGIHALPTACAVIGIALNCSAAAVAKNPGRVVAIDRLDTYIPDGRTVDFLKIDVEGFEEAAMESALSRWRTAGAPKVTVFECNVHASLRYGFHTLFWRRFAREFGCAIDYSLEFPIMSRLRAIFPAVDGFMLRRCGGANHMIICDSSTHAANLFRQIVGLSASAVLSVLAVMRLKRRRKSRVSME